MESNPFEIDYQEPAAASSIHEDLGREAKPKAAKSERQVQEGALITAPGAYPDVDAADYHRNANLLPGPSLSSSGAKTILGKSPFHYWFDSALNPNRPPEPDKPHFNVGKAAHDLILLSDRWPEFYHVTPKGFTRTATTKFADAIAEADEAAEAGMTVLRHDDAQVVIAVAEAVKKNDLAVATLTNGVTEETLVWQDPSTGVWLRARPDFRPNSIIEKREIRVVSDLKFVAPTNATPDGFSKSIFNFGYHQSAAWYADGIKSVYGDYPTHWVHIVVEKPEAGVEPAHAPMTVSLYELPGEDMERGRIQNRRAIDLFARCLDSGKWPGFADDEPRLVGLPIWARMRIEDLDPNEFAMAAT